MGRTFHDSESSLRVRLAPGMLTIAAFLVFGLNTTLTAALPGYLIALGEGTFVAGLQNSLFIVAAIVLRIPLEPVVARIGSAAALVAGALGFAVPCALLGACAIWAPETHVIIVLHVLQAFGLALFHPGVAQYLTAVSPPDLLGRRLGIVRFATTASLMAGPVALFPVVDVAGYAAFFFALAAVGALGTACACALPSTHVVGVVCGNGGRGAQKDGNAAPARETRPNHAPADAPKTAGALAPPSTYVLLIAGPVLLGCGYSVVLSFGDLFAAHALGSFPDGALFALISIGGLAGCLAASAAVAPTTVKRAVLAFAVADCAGLALLGIDGAAPLVVTGALLFGAGYFGATAAFTTAAGIALQPQPAAGQPGHSGALAPARAAAHGSAFLSRQQSGLDAGMILGSFIAGALLQTGVSFFLIFVTLAGLVAAFSIAWEVLYNRGR